MVQWLRALVVLPEVLGLVPSTHITAHNLYNPDSGESDTLFWTLQEAGTHDIYTFR